MHPLVFYKHLFILGEEKAKRESASSSSRPPSGTRLASLYSVLCTLYSVLCTLYDLLLNIDFNLLHTLRTFPGDTGCRRVSNDPGNNREAGQKSKAIQHSKPNPSARG